MKIQFATRLQIHVCKKNKQKKKTNTTCLFNLYSFLSFDYYSFVIVCHLFLSNTMIFAQISSSMDCHLFNTSWMWSWKREEILKEEQLAADTCLNHRKESRVSQKNARSESLSCNLREIRFMIRLESHLSEVSACRMMCAFFGTPSRYDFQAPDTPNL